VNRPGPSRYSMISFGRKRPIKYVEGPEGYSKNSVDLYHRNA
jgi:hypothetical protein